MVVKKEGVNLMKSKTDILKAIRNIININNMSIYSVANIAGINRSTLQKSLSGDRNLNLRQFDALINVLPLSNTERNNLYKEYLSFFWSPQKILQTEIVMDILDTIERTLSKKNNLQLTTNYLPSGNFYSVSGRYNIIKAIKDEITALSGSNKETNIYVYMPFNNDLFISSAGDLLSDCNGNISVSILLELLKPDGFNSNENPMILKSILPLLLDDKDIYSFNHIYVDSYFYDNHLAPYPYYVVCPDKALLFNSTLDALISVTDKNTIKNICNIHRRNTQKASKLNVLKIKLDDCLTHLIKNQISSNMYTIAYNPCVSHFTPPSMYDELIDDDLPNKKELLDIIANRIKAINEVKQKYVPFNVSGVDDFVNNGNLLVYDQPYLKKCSISQRIEILNNIIDRMEDSTLIMRAYNEKDLHISKKFEITDIQNMFSFDITVYQDNEYLRLINIEEPIISRYFIDFIHNILETPLVYTYDQTKQLLIDAVEKLKRQK